MGKFWDKLSLGKRSRNALLKASTWLGGERGSMNVLYAVALIPMIGALGLATDTARGYLLKARLSQSIDQAVLAGGKVIFSPTRNDDVLKYFSANFPNSGTIAFDTPFDSNFMDARVTLSSPVEGGEAGSETLYITASATIPTTFMRVLNAFGCTSCDDITVVAESEVERTVRALDAVITLDMSGSMDGSAKIGAARDGLVDFMDSVYGPENDVSPQLTIEGTTYDLINIGFVVWNSKTNVTQMNTSGVMLPLTSAPAESAGGSYTNPVTLATSQSDVWNPNNSEVNLIMDPRDTSAGGHLPGGWSGCVYARYLGGERDGLPASQNADTPSINNNDADLVRGAQFDVGSGAEQKDWPAYEPMARFEAEPRSNSWSNSAPESEPNTTRWRINGTPDYRPKSCSIAYYNDMNTGTYSTDGNHNLDLPKDAMGNWQLGVRYSAPNTSRPVWVRSAMAPRDSQYSGFMRFFNDQTRAYSVPEMGSNPASNDCSPCLSRGIVPLTPNKPAIQGRIASIGNAEPDGNTNILQGLYWGWEVLMPGAPFDQALVSTPFTRDRYIILVTDGAQVGGNGDAYKGRFGSGENAGDNTDAAHGTISSPVESAGWQYGDPIPAFTTTNNNLDNRLRILARNVKNEGIKLYIIGFDLADHPNELRMLSALASPPDGDSPAYFYAADDAADLQAALAEISSRLTDIRLSM